MTTTQNTKPGNGAKARPEPNQKLIAVASGKGGVGKTWFSSTLAHALARSGKRVLLFDGDLGLANVDIQLGLMAKRDLNDVITGRLPLSRVIHHFEEGGFDVIVGRSGQASLSSLPLQRLNEVLKQLRAESKNYDAIIMDLGAGVDKTVRFLSSAAGTTLLVTNDEPTSLTDAYAFIKLANAIGHADTIQLVINVVESKPSGERTYNTLLRACKNFLKISPPLIGMVSKDNHVKDAIRAQTPYLTRYPATQTAMDIEKIMAQVSALIRVS